MNQQASSGCGIAIGFRVDVHGGRFCDVFVTANALQTIRSAEGRYPPGTLIVKAKYPDGNRQKIELFTVMCKRAAGYSPDHGDWEYCVVDANAAHVLARGKIASCIRCHDDYASTDFVTRAYLK